MRPRPRRGRAGRLRPGHARRLRRRLSSERLLAALAPVENRDRPVAGITRELGCAGDVAPDVRGLVRVRREGDRDIALAAELEEAPVRIDRKSTRLNSSHSQISYAVF